MLYEQYCGSSGAKFSDSNDEMMNRINLCLTEGVHKFEGKATMKWVYIRVCEIGMSLEN